MAQPASSSTQSVNDLNTAYWKQVKADEDAYRYRWKSLSGRPNDPANHVCAIAAAALPVPSHSAPALLPEPITAARVSAPPIKTPSAPFKIIPYVREAGQTTASKLEAETEMAALDGLTKIEKIRRYAELVIKVIVAEIETVLTKEQFQRQVEEFVEELTKAPHSYRGLDAVDGEAFDGAGVRKKAPGLFVVNLTADDPKIEDTDPPHAAGKIMGGRETQDDDYLEPTPIQFIFREGIQQAEIAVMCDGSGPGSLRLASFIKTYLPLCLPFVLKQISEQELSLSIDDAIPTALTTAFHFLSTRYQQMNPQRPFDLSTAVCVLKVGERLYCANAGDSRAFLVKDDSEVPLNVSDDINNPQMRQRQEHTAVDRFGRIYNNPNQGQKYYRFSYSYQHPDTRQTVYMSHEAGRLVGCVPSMCLPPAITLITHGKDWDDGDYVVLVSDGVTPGGATLKEVANAVRIGKQNNIKLETLVRRILEAADRAWGDLNDPANRRASSDNTSIIIWRLRK